MINQVSPFSSFTDFFRPIYPHVDTEKALPEENFAFLRESINLFDFGQRGYTLLPEVEEDNALIFVEREGSNQSWSEIAIRIAKIATIIIPLLKLVGAAIYFLANDFQLQKLEDEDSDNALLEHTFIQIEKTTKPLFRLLNDDMIKLLFKYLGPKCFQLASTDNRTYNLMKGDLSLENYRVGREILKQCFLLESTQNIQVDKSVSEKLFKCVTAFDLEEALKRAHLNDDLKLRVHNLTVVSEAFAEFDKIKSLEILEHAYNEVYPAERLDESLSETSHLERNAFDELAAKTRLARSFMKCDSEKANEIIEGIQKYSIGERYKEAIVSCPEMQLFLPLHLLKCQEAETMELEEKNIYLTIELIANLFKIFPEKANFIVEDLLEFMNNFIRKFPEVQEKKVFFLKELCRVIAPFDRSRLRELAELAMKEAGTLGLEKYLQFYLATVNALVKMNLMEVAEATNRAHKLIEFVEQSDFDTKTFYLTKDFYLLELSAKCKDFNKELSNKLMEKMAAKIKEISEKASASKQDCFRGPTLDLLVSLAKSYFDVFMFSIHASNIWAHNNQDQAFEMLELALNARRMVQGLMDGLEESGSSGLPWVKKEMNIQIDTTFKSISQVNFIRAKQVAEKFMDPSIRLLAMTSVIEGFLSKSAKFKAEAEFG